MLADFGPSLNQLVDDRVSFIEDVEKSLGDRLVIQHNSFMPLLEALGVLFRRIVANLAVDQFAKSLEPANSRKLSRACVLMFGPHRTRNIQERRGKRRRDSNSESCLCIRLQHELPRMSHRAWTEFP
jgi:hypothetical protein